MSIDPALREADALAAAQARVEELAVGLRDLADAIKAEWLAAGVESAMEKSRLARVSVEAHRYAEHLLDRLPGTQEPEKT